MNIKFIIKELKHYKVLNLSVFITLFISSLFINSSLFLLISAFKNNLRNSNMILIFIILFGLIFLISIIMLNIIMNINFESRRTSIINLRLIGISIKKIFKSLFQESLLVLLPSFFLGFLVSLFINNVIVSEMIGKEILPANFKIYYSFLDILIVLSIGIISLIFVVYIIVKKYKNINNNFRTEFKKKIKREILRFFFGLMFIISFFLLVIFNKSNVLYLFGGIFFLIGLAIMLDIVLKYAFDFIFSLTRKNFMFSSSVKNMQFNANLISKIILILINSMIFLYFTNNVIGMNKYSQINQGSDIYLKGLQFLGFYLNIVFLTFTILVTLNGFIMYLNIIKKENIKLRKLSFTKKKLFIRNFIQLFLIWLIFVFLVFMPTLMVSIIWNDQQSLSNVFVWIIEISVLLIIMFLVVAINFFFFIKKN